MSSLSFSAVGDPLLPPLALPPLISHRPREASVMQRECVPGYIYPLLRLPPRLLRCPQANLRLHRLAYSRK